MNWLAEFHWIRPWWLLAALPVLWLCWRVGQGRSSPWQQACDPALLDALLVSPGTQQRWGRWVLAAGGLLAVIALAGPSWQRLPMPVFQSAAAKVLVLDLSRSMDAADLQPSRLARARYAAMDLLDALPEGRIGVVVFAGSAFSLVPLTDDRNTARHLIQSLETGMMPVQGGRIGAGLQQAMTLLEGGKAATGDVILLTDSTPEPGARASAEQLRAQGHRLWVVGVGTPRGAPIPADDGGWLKDDQGAIVLAHLDVAALRTLAAAGGGGYRALPAGGLRADSFAFGDARLDTRSADDTLRSERHVDAGQWLVWLLLPLAALAFRRGWLSQAALLVCLMPCGAALAAPSPWWHNPDQRGQQLLDDGQPRQAADTFRDPHWRALALHEAGEHAAAAEALAGLDTAKAHYNRGNALAHAGRLDDAIAAYDKALALDPEHQDARHNRALLDQLRQQQQPQDQNSGQQDSQDGASQAEQNNQASGQDNTGQSDSDQASADNGQPQDGSQSPSQQAGDDNADTPDEATREPQTAQADTGPQTEVPESAEAGEDSAQPRAGQALSEAERQARQEQQALEQWLRRVPDDPGGLLRRKFQRQQQRRNPEQMPEQPW